MYLFSVALRVFTFFGQVPGVVPEIVGPDTLSFPSLQSTPFGASPTPFDWWPFDDFWDSLTSQPPSATGSSLRSPAATAFLAPSALSQTSSSPSPSIIDITALPPSTTNAPHPRARTKEDLKPFSLAPIFVIAGLILGALVGWSAFNSYDSWVAKDSVVTLVPGPAYVPVDHGTDAERGKPTDNVHGSPSKHTRHGTPYSSYSVGKGFLGRIPSARFRKSPTPIPQEMTGSEKTYAWPSLPGSSHSTPSQSRSTTADSTKLARTASVVLDDPFSSTGTDAKSPTVIAPTRTSTRSTIARVSRFGEMLGGGEDDNSVVISPISPTIPAEGEGALKTGLFNKIKSKSKSVRRKKRDGDDTVNVLASAETSPRKSSWAWIPSIDPGPYTDIPVSASSPRPQSHRTPDSSPRKPSYVRSSEGVRMVDTSVLPASPPTLTSPRLDSEFFLRGTILETSTPGTRTPGSMRSPRAVTGFRRFDTDTPGAKCPSFPRPGESACPNEDRTPTNFRSRHDPGRDPSVTSISKFPGDPPPKRTPAERFYARRSALGQVEEIVQRSKSQTNVAGVQMDPGRQELDTVEEGRQFGRVGEEFESGGIEQRLFKS